MCGFLTCWQPEMFFGIATKESGTSSLATIGDIHQPKRSAQALLGVFGGMSKWRRDREASGNHSFGGQLYQKIAPCEGGLLNNFYKHLVGLGLLWSLKKPTLLTLAPKQLDFFKVLNKAMQKVRCLPLTLPKFNISGETNKTNPLPMFISGFFGVWNI